jgi:hypothetical protein
MSIILLTINSVFEEAIIDLSIDRRQTTSYRLIIRQVQTSQTPTTNKQTNFIMSEEEGVAEKRNHHCFGKGRTSVPVGRIGQAARQGKYATRGAGAPVYLAAVLEYLLLLKFWNWPETPEITKVILWYVSFFVDLIVFVVVLLSLK